MNKPKTQMTEHIHISPKAKKKLALFKVQGDFKTWSEAIIAAVEGRRKHVRG